MFAKLKFTDEQRADLISRYANGETLKALAVSQNCDARTVRALLSSAGATIRRVSAATGKEAAIVARYELGESIESLSYSYSIDPRKVRQVLRGAGVNQRTVAQANRRISLHESFFDIIDTEAKAYFLGWLYADGYVGAHGNFRLSLQMRDAPIVEEFRRQLSYEGEVKIKPAINKAILTINSKHMTKQLIKHGCTPNKTFTLTFPNWMPDQLLPHFIRGFIDGDGCYYVGQKSPCLSAVGTRAMCTRVFEILAEKCGINFQVSMLHGKDNGIVTARTGGAGQVRRVADYLYRDATLYLERKKAKADSIVPRNKPAGEKCHLSKLTTESVAQIRGRIKSGIPAGRIAAEFNVSIGAIENIKYGRTWKSS